MASPLEISVALHYRCHPGDYGKGRGDNNWHAPAVQSAIAFFVERGLLAKTPDGCGAQYYATDALQVYVNALCDVPMPVQQWVIPDKAA